MGAQLWLDSARRQHCAAQLAAVKPGLEEVTRRRVVE